jgi:hypothetical protein
MTTMIPATDLDVALRDIKTAKLEQYRRPAQTATKRGATMRWRSSKGRMVGPLTFATAVI